MYHPTTRVLALLRNHGRMTGAELARRLEVNARTLRRYITILQDLGAPIIAERGRHGAYELDAGFTLPPMMFTNDEAIALALGLAEMVRAAESARMKLEEAMPGELQKHIQSLAETITLDLNAEPVGAPAEVMLALSVAAQNRRRVHLRYRSSQKTETEREFDPYGLAHRGGCWYAVGHCHLRRGLRSFRLDRIVEVGLTEMSFERPTHFDAAAYVVQAIATLPRHFTFEVLLKTDLLTAQKEIFAVLGILSPAEEGVFLRGTTDDLNWMARQLAKLSFDFTVIAPEELRTALHNHAQILINRAGNH